MIFSEIIKRFQSSFEIGVFVSKCKSVNTAAAQVTHLITNEMANRTQCASEAVTFAQQVGSGKLTAIHKTRAVHLDQRQATHISCKRISSFVAIKPYTNITT